MRAVKLIVRSSTKVLMLLILMIALILSSTGMSSAMSEAQRRIFMQGIPYFNIDMEGSGSCASSGGVPYCDALARVRREMTANITEAQRVLIYKVVPSETAHNPNTDHGRAYAQVKMESWFNRAAARGFQLELSLTTNAPPGYYQNFCNASGGAPWKNCAARVAEFRSIFDEIFESIMNGSNMARFATDNASMSMPTFPPRSQTVCGMMQGEDTECRIDTYGIPTWPEGDGVNRVPANQVAGLTPRVEYFFTNNGHAWAERMREECGDGGGVLNCSPGGGNGDINDTAIAMSWPESSPQSRGPNQAYLEGIRAINQERVTNNCITMLVNGESSGASCDLFVATVLRNTVDPNFHIWLTDTQYVYLRNNPNFEHVVDGRSRAATTEDMRPGDILVLNGHIMLYVELPDGTGRIADASCASRTASHHGPPYFSDWRGNYSVFRWSGGG